jgi:hypothetical protein
VMPALHPEGIALSWLDLAALLAVGGTAALFGLWRVRGRALVPRNDPYFEASLRYQDT